MAKKRTKPSPNEGLPEHTADDAPPSIEEAGAALIHIPGDGEVVQHSLPLPGSPEVVPHNHDEVEEYEDEDVFGDEDANDEVEDDDDEDEEPEPIPRNRHQIIPPAPPAFTVADQDPQIRALLNGLLTDDRAAHVIAGYLEEHHDPRAPNLRELLAVPCVVPAVAPPRGIWCPMACGTWFAINRFNRCVTGGPYPGTWQHRLFREECGQIGKRVDIPTADQTDARLIEAFGRVRRALVYMLLGTREDLVRSQAAALTETRMARLAPVFLRFDPEVTVPWACELRRVSPHRFKMLFHHIRSREEFRDFFVALLNAVRPGWSDQILET